MCSAWYNFARIKLLTPKLADSFITDVDNSSSYELRILLLLFFVFFVYFAVEFCKNSENVLLHTVKWRH